MTSDQIINQIGAKVKENNIFQKGYFVKGRFTKNLPTGSENFFYIKLNSDEDGNSYFEEDAENYTVTRSEYELVAFFNKVDTKKALKILTNNIKSCHGCIKKYGCESDKIYQDITGEPLENNCVIIRVFFEIEEMETPGCSIKNNQKLCIEDAVDCNDIITEF